MAPSWGNVLYRNALLLLAQLSLLLTNGYLIEPLNTSSHLQPSTIAVHFFYHPPMCPEHPCSLYLCCAECLPCSYHLTSCSLSSLCLSDLIQATQETNVNVPQMADTLMERVGNASWVVVFKALITTHHLMVNGNEVSLLHTHLTHSDYILYVCCLLVLRAGNKLSEDSFCL